MKRMIMFIAIVLVVALGVAVFEINTKPKCEEALEFSAEKGDR